MKRERKPSYAYQRWWGRRRTAKQRIHELLRQDPSLTIEQLVMEVRCPRAYARIWRKNFFGPGVEV